jgi:beta-mannosidase
MAYQRTSLSSGWSFKQASKQGSEFLPTSQFPTAIHLDLMKHGIIPDPYLDINWAKMQWVGEEEWLYRTTFDGPGKGSSGGAIKHELVFEGLDTHTTISLNGKEIKKTDNMYWTYHVDVTDIIKTEAENELEILFHSTFLIAKQLEKEAPQQPLFWHNGDKCRLQVRKAPYSFGWDFVPIFLTSGPWRPIHLDTYTAKINDLAAVADVAKDLSIATINVTAEIEGSGAEKFKAQIFDPKGQLVQEKEVAVSSDKSAKLELQVKNPELWWPSGNGEQPLYQVKAVISSGSSGSVLCESKRRIGIRRLQLVQHPLKDQPGTSFYFEVNNVPIYSRGSNWIPTDMFLPRADPSRFRSWLELAKRGNQNMVRVWGGGVYEDPSFYDAADELGLMIWHDFMLACGSYPATPEFLKVIEEESIHIVKQLRHHPCIVVWCGNNEDHMFADKYNAKYDYDDHNPESWLKTDWPARIIYDKILPDLVQKYVPEIPYHPGSPWGGKPAMDPTIGDVHAWDVWMKASAQYPYQWYYQIAGRFVSEFGLKSYPPVKTIEEYITDPKERHPQSRTLDSHLKASSKSPWARDYRTVALYIMENYKICRGLKHWVYGSQLVQAEAMQFAFTGWRRLWKGPGQEECAGALVWQLNDCWPSVSWSLADYKLRPKYAFYSIKRACEPIAICANRVEVVKHRPNDLTEANVVREMRLQAWGSNFTTKAESYKMHIQKLDLASGNVLWDRVYDVTLPENRSTEVFDEPLEEIEAQNVIVSVRLLRDAKVVSRFVDWPQPIKYLDLPRPDIKMEVKGDDIVVSAPLPVKALVFEVDDDAVVFDENVIDLIPGDEQTVHAKGLNGRKPGLIHLALAED